MVAGNVYVESIQWGERTMSVRAKSLYDGDVSMTVAYRHVSGVAFVPSKAWCDEKPYVLFDAGRSPVWITFNSDAEARDTAAELARRMEAAG